MKRQRFLVADDNAKGFVDCWSDRYKYQFEELYSKNIGKPLTEKRLMKLFQWKNGYKKISRGKSSSIQRNYIRLLKQKNLPVLQTPKCGRLHLKIIRGGPIWGIFWLHCNKRAMFPIFDQHTYRAMTYINSGSIKELSKSKQKVLEIYFDEYIPFVSGYFRKINAKKTDKALFCLADSPRIIEDFAQTAFTK